MTNRRLLPFNLLRPASFASYHLLHVPISLYIRPWPSTRIMYIYIHHSFAPLLSFSFILVLYFSFSSSSFFFFSLLSLFVFSCVCDVCQSPDDVFSSTASIIVLHVFAIAKSITCHKCAVAAHFEEWCEASYTLIMVEHDCALRTGRDNTEKETEEQRMNFSDQLYLLLIFV